MYQVSVFPSSDQSLTRPLDEGDAVKICRQIDHALSNSIELWFKLVENVFAICATCHNFRNARNDEHCCSVCFTQESVRFLLCPKNISAVSKE